MGSLHPPGMWIQREFLRTKEKQCFEGNASASQRDPSGSASWPRLQRWPWSSFSSRARTFCSWAKTSKALLDTSKFLTLPSDHKILMQRQVISAPPALLSEWQRENKKGRNLVSWMTFIREKKSVKYSVPLGSPSKGVARLGTSSLCSAIQPRLSPAKWRDLHQPEWRMDLCETETIGLPRWDVWKIVITDCLGK